MRGIKLIKKKLFSGVSKIEKLVLLLLGGFFVWGMLGLISVFFMENSESKPEKGGVYKEGVVGDVSNLVLNPLYVYGKRDKSFESDVTSLVFSGLMRFDTNTGKTVDYIATHTLSADKKTYIFRLKEGVRWHDGADLTIDDIFYTFNTVIKSEDFNNDILKQAFKNVEIKKLSDNEISFTIQYPYKYFLTNFTVGILPQHILKDISVMDLEYYKFSQNPIGSGPYKFDSLNEEKKGVFKLSLSAFENSSLFDVYLSKIEFYIYSRRNALSLDVGSLNGVRPFPKVNKNDFTIPDNFTLKEYSLPQYSALFFNMKKAVFDGYSGRQVRLAMQLATNKNDIIKNIVSGVRIDTPLLESDDSDWVNEFDLIKAKGALKDGGYFLPSSKPKTFVPKKSDSLYITFPTTVNVFETNRSEYVVKEGENQEENNQNDFFIIEGKYPVKIAKTKIFIDDEFLREEDKPEMARSWSFPLALKDNFNDGTHEIRVEFWNFDGELEQEDAISVYLKPLAQEEKDVNQKYEIRENKKGEKLQLTLVTSDKPYYYKEVANYLKDDYGKIGIDLNIKVLNMNSFLDRVKHREYDILLYGQNLGYNLDIYEFFHESQVGKDNLSDYQDPTASILIEEIRRSHVSDVRAAKMQKLRESFKKNIPAVFLFSPTYQYNFDKDLKALDILSIGSHKDRFSNITSAYIVEQRSLDNATWLDFPQWFLNNFISFITY
ncbi:MAG TPA: hypothetical protein EYG89_03320 [Bacteroidia bacterium]|nr:hypothetical protein [Bacteroidia bacterium]HIQ57507.1 hypothetical protein [Candidatus Gracilibacteria bacterium]